MVRLIAHSVHQGGTAHVHRTGEGRGKNYMWTPENHAKYQASMRRLYEPYKRKWYNPARYTDAPAWWEGLFGGKNSEWNSDYSWDKVAGGPFSPSSAEARRTAYFEAGGQTERHKYKRVVGYKYNADHTGIELDIRWIPKGETPSNFRPATPKAAEKMGEWLRKNKPHSQYRRYGSHVDTYERVLPDARFGYPKYVDNLPNKIGPEIFPGSDIGPEIPPRSRTQKKRPTPQRAPKPRLRSWPQKQRVVVRKKTARGYRCPNGYRWNGTACVRVNKYGKPRRSSRQVFLDKWSRQWVARHQRRWAPGRIRNLRKSVNWYKYLKGTPLEKPWLLWHFNKWNNQRKWYNRYHRRRGILRR